MGTTAWNMPKINDLMKKRGMLQKDLAIKLGESVQLISYYFTSAPSIKKAQRLAEALSNGQDIDWRDLIV